MVEQIFQHTSGSTNSASDPPQSVRDQALQAGRELKDKAVEFAETSGEKLKEQASEFADMAKDVTSQATDRLKETVSEQRGAGAEYVSHLAETMRRAAREFDNDLPIAGKYIRKAATQVERIRLNTDRRLQRPRGGRAIFCPPPADGVSRVSGSGRFCGGPLPEEFIGYVGIICNPSASSQSRKSRT
jgi:gas vesicle protein